jgi:hypothetical protein
MALGLRRLCLEFGVRILVGSARVTEFRLLFPQTFLQLPLHSITHPLPQGVQPLADCPPFESIANMPYLMI